MSENKNGALRQDVFDYSLKTFDISPEYPWGDLPLYAVLRRSDNKKWYALIMNISRSKLGLSGKEHIDILDIKCNAATREFLLSAQKGFFPAYHLNRQNWITVILDGSVDKKLLYGLLGESYELAKTHKKTMRYEPKSWVFPANPNYFDLEKAFAKSDIIIWKQGLGVIKGDTVYLYMAAPFSCIRYKCRVIETDIPYEYNDGKIAMTKVMKIKRLYTYDDSKFTLEYLKKHGISSVRNRRSIPYGLLCDLEKASNESEII